MGIVLFQLSDIHFSTNKEQNPILDKIEAFYGSLRNCINVHDSVVVVYSGDIADWGKVEEYEMAKDFLISINNTIFEITKILPIHIIVPGNHDLNHAMSPEDIELRDIILKQINAKEELTPVKIGYCLKPQNDYRNFVSELKTKINVHACTSLVDNFIIEADCYLLSFVLINSAHISQEREPFGEMWLPISTIEEIFKQIKEPHAISITVMHHPYKWYNTENHKDIKLLLEKYSDMIVTGHEHSPDQFEKSRNTLEQHLYIEGGVLQDFDNKNSSTYNQINIDQDQKSFSIITHSYLGDSFSPITDPSEHIFIRFRQEIISGITVKPVWNDWLEQIGTDFKHPRKSLVLSDIFVYPDLQLLNINKSCKPTGIIRDGDVLGYIQDKKHICIAGAEKTGKTCFAKRLFVDLTRAGYIPVIIGSDFTIGKSHKKHFHDRVRDSFKERVTEIYENSCHSRVWDAEPKNRVLIIDNYDEINLNFTAREEMLKWSSTIFGIIIVLTSPGIRYAEILNQRDTEAVLLTYDHADILEADQETTHLLIRKWLWAGCDRYSTSKEEIHKNTIRYGQAIQSLIGQGIVPSLPLYVLMMTQQLNANGTLDGTNGLYGSMYEKIIRDIIITGSMSHSDFEVKFNYLTEFAFSLFQKSLKFVNVNDFNEWHTNYCEMYGQDLICENLIAVFRGIGVFRNDCPEIGFKYRYYYCFFLARYISLHMFDAAMDTIILSMCQTLYATDTANTMVFLCHLNKDPKILNMVLETLKKDFKESPEFDFATHPSFLPVEQIKIPLTLTTNTDPHHQHIEDCQAADELQRPHGLDELEKRIEKEMDGETIKLMNEMSSAFQSIRICGQILRNSYAGMIGQRQVEIISECYKTCLRLIDSAMKIMVDEREDIALLLGKNIRNKFPRMEDTELDHKIRESVQGWALQICYGFAKHASNSLGLAALKPSFDKVMKSQIGNPGFRLLDLSTRLDYFDEFPEANIFETSEMLDEGFIGLQVLRIIVWEHLKLFPTEYRARQRVCNHLNIKSGDASYIDPKLKRAGFSLMKLDQNKQVR